jgi:hypothetical protein
MLLLFWLSWYCLTPFSLEEINSVSYVLMYAGDRNNQQIHMYIYLYFVPPTMLRYDVHPLYIIWSAHNNSMGCHSKCLSFQNFIWIPTNMQFSFVLTDYCYMYFLYKHFRLWMLYRKVSKIGMQTYCTRFF